MQISRKTINSAINRKFIKPLNEGCNYNVSKLDSEKITKHKETISILKQAHKTLKNVDYNLKSYNLVDANTLLRASFEYIMMAMMIQFDENVYDEFTTLGIERDKTRVCKIIDKFRTHMNEICEPVFKDINRKEKLAMLSELYDKLCNYTHSTLIVSTIIEINSQREKEIFQLLMYQNYYFLKVLHFICLKYFTNDTKHYLELENVGFAFLFLWVDITNKKEEYKIDFSKYKDLLYYDKNAEYFKKDKKEAEKFNVKTNELTKDIQDNPEVFYEELFKFLK